MRAGELSLKNGDGKLQSETRTPSPTIYKNQLKIIKLETVRLVLENPGVECFVSLWSGFDKTPELQDTDAKHRNGILSFYFFFLVFVSWDSVSLCNSFGCLELTS